MVIIMNMPGLFLCIYVVTMFFAGQVYLNFISSSYIMFMTVMIIPGFLIFNIFTLYMSFLRELLC